jgi:hypothetical protein
VHRQAPPRQAPRPARGHEGDIGLRSSDIRTTQSGIVQTAIDS